MLTRLALTNTHQHPGRPQSFVIHSPEATLDPAEIDRFRQAAVNDFNGLRNETPSRIVLLSKDTDHA